MQYLRWLLFPFSLLYGLVVIIRNWCYEAGFFKSHAFDLPLISVGNLDVGGSGKTPMTEYLVRLLKPDHKLATLSRGYGRNTSGYLVATTASTANEIGDEPAQLKHKFPDITVAVCEDRVTGVNHLKSGHQLIILDDAYQHRAIKPGFSILLFSYHQLSGLNLLLPAGNRREPFYGRKRADVIIVSKCPGDLSVQDQEKIKSKIAPFPHQQVLFTGMDYQPLRNPEGNEVNMDTIKRATIFLLTGIANDKPLMDYISAYTTQIIQYKYPDHHHFSLKNITKLANDFNACKADKKIIITTEKDMQRLGEAELLPIIKLLPIYVLPVGVYFLNDSGRQFDQLIENYVKQYTAYSGVH